MTTKSKGGWKPKHTAMLVGVPKDHNLPRLLHKVAEITGKGYPATYQKWRYVNEGPRRKDGTRTPVRTKKARTTKTRLGIDTSGSMKTSIGKSLIRVLEPVTKPVKMQLLKVAVRTHGYATTAELNSLHKGLDINIPQLGLYNGAIAVHKRFTRFVKDYVKKEYSNMVFGYGKVKDNPESVKIFRKS